MRKKLAVRTVGCPQWPRYLLADERDRYWTGKRWSRNRRKGLLYANWNAVSHEYRRLEERQWSSTPSREYEAVISVRVWSGQEYSIEQLQDYLHRAINILLNHEGHGTGPVPDSLVRIDMDWGKLKEAQPEDQA